MDIIGLFVVVMTLNLQHINLNNVFINIVDDAVVGRDVSRPRHIFPAFQWFRVPESGFRVFQQFL